MRFRARRGARDGLHKSFRGWQRIAVVAVVLFIAFGLVTARLIVWPARECPPVLTLSWSSQAGVIVWTWRYDLLGSIERRCWSCRRAGRVTAAPARR